MRVIRACLHGIDVVNEWTGKTVAWLVLLLAVLITVAVIFRYVFNSPIVWDMDVTIQIAGVLAILTGGYTLLYKGHIAVDTLVERLTPRTRVIVSLFTSFITLCVIGGLLWSTVGLAIDSLMINESFTSFIAPPIYPFKIIMAIGIALLLLQGIAKFIRDLEIVINRKGESQQ